MLVEPYFNDDAGGFASLRCTVVGDEIVETVKRTNRSNITSNVSSGGTAEKAELSDEQKEMVLATARAVGVDYAGIDLLVCGGKSVIGEVNIGPFTVFSKYTGAPVGKALAEYAMRKCDASTKLH
jgi:glutathione synthase/RimK-type ligase-like ATP-grasp enzyme